MDSPLSLITRISDPFFLRINYNNKSIMIILMCYNFLQILNDLSNKYAIVLKSVKCKNKFVIKQVF